MMTLARHLYHRLMRRGRVIALTALSSVPGIVYWLFAFDAPDDRLASTYSDILASAGYTFSVAALILSSATLREERDSGTLPYVYMRPLARSWFAAEAILAGTAAALTVGIAGWLVSALAAASVGAGFGVAVPALTLFVAAGIGYSAIFVPLGYMAPRSLLIGLGYVVVWETILANAVTGLAQLSIWRISLSIYADLADEFGNVATDSLGPVTPGAWGGVIKIAGVVIAGWAVLTWALRRRDAL